MNNVDDRSGATAADHWKQAVLAAAHNEELFAAATRNFITLVAQAMRLGSSPAMLGAFEEHYTLLFNGILPGLGKWVTQVFADARAVVAKESA